MASSGYGTVLAAQEVADLGGRHFRQQVKEEGDILPMSIRQEPWRLFLLTFQLATLQVSPCKDCFCFCFN